MGVPVTVLVQTGEMVRVGEEDREGRLKDAVGLTVMVGVWEVEKVREEVGERLGLWEVEKDSVQVEVRVGGVDMLGERVAERVTVELGEVERQSVKLEDLEKEGKRMEGEPVKVACLVVGLAERE